MLVHTYNHLIPHSNGTPTVLSSPSTSTYIPDIPYDDYTHSHNLQSDVSNVVSSRRERRSRVAPYLPSLSSNPMSLQSRNCYQGNLMEQQTVLLHSPRPVTFFNPSQAFTNVVPPNAYADSSLAQAFTPGAHGSILSSHESQQGLSSLSGTSFDELTATQMAFMQASTASRELISSEPVPSSSNVESLLETRPSVASFPRIRVPEVPSIPQVSPALLTAEPVNLTPLRPPNGAPHLPDAIPPEPSQLRIHPGGTLPPPSETFPTPVELLGELSVRDAEAAKKDRRRTERRKAQMMQEAETLGFTPSDPDTISTHDKKRLYLDCLEQYVIYLHNQLRLAGLEPVPVERVSSGRGLTSRSIRTMIVHLKTMTSKLHAQKREAERKYEELRAQLGAYADSTAPCFTPLSSLTSKEAFLPNTIAQKPILTDCRTDER